MKIIATLLVLVCMTANSLALSLTSVVTDDSGKNEFREYTQVRPGDGVAFKLDSDSAQAVKVTYLLDGKEQNSFEIDISAGSSHFLPSEEKAIVLEKEGVHSFLFKTPDEEITATIFCSGKSKAELSGIKDIDFKNTEKQSVTLPAVFKQEKKADFSNLRTIAQPDTTRASGSEIYKALAPSVVLVCSDDGEGSGSIISKDGKILTNYHVIEGTDHPRIVFKPAKFEKVSSKENYLARVIKVDEEKDLALLQLSKPPAGLMPIKLGSVENIEVASGVHAIGHPKGNYWTYTQGVISQMRPEFGWSSGDGKQHTADVLQTQTPINPGNSGGPLFDSDMNLIGVNSFMQTESQGLNFAVAITSINEFLAQKESYKSAPKIEQEDWVDSGIPVDFDEDGINEAIVFDKNMNGKPDYFVSDYELDGKLDLFGFDEDENGILELTIEIKRPETGSLAGREIAIIEYDYNQDGQMDFREYDLDVDGEIEKSELIE